MLGSSVDWFVDATALLRTPALVLAIQEVTALNRPVLIGYQLLIGLSGHLDRRAADDSSGIHAQTDAFARA